MIHTHVVQITLSKFANADAFQVIDDIEEEDIEVASTKKISLINILSILWNIRLAVKGNGILWLL